jgi:enoyl-CoA hydratase/carnithine racemase
MSVVASTEQGVTRLRLNRPEKRNAFTREMVDQLHHEISRTMADPESRCLIIEAEGDFAGDRPYAELVAADQRWAEIFRLLDQGDTPSVAIVRGCAFAGGFTLAMGCDFVLADSSAQFQVSEMRHNFPAAINTPVLSKLVGPRRALEMAILGDTLSAKQLFDMGLLNRLCDDAQSLAAQAEAFINTIVARDSIAVAQTKQLHRATRQNGLSEALNMGALVNTQVALNGKFAQANAALKK